MNRVIAVLTVASFVCSLPGCTAVQKRPMQTLSPTTWERIAGFTTIDGMYHPCHCEARVEDEKLRLRARDTLTSSDPNGPMPEDQTPVRNIASVDVVEISAGWTVLTVVGSLLLAFIGIVAIAALTKKSCPFLYSFDGQQYVFDGEPYGGAIMSSLARTDYSELKHLVSVAGEYRLRLANEVDETQHTDSLELYVVDHDPRSTVVIDPEGGAHAFRSFALLRSAIDEHGNDLLRWLSETDHSFWYPDLVGAAQSLPLKDTRNHLTLEFQRPPGVDKIYLVTNVATGLWGSNSLAMMLAMRGDKLQQFYDEVNASPALRRQIEDWNEREELFHLGIQLEVNGRWERRGFIRGGGPFIAENRAIPVSLEGVRGGTIRIPLNPPIGFWSMNSFKLAWDESAAQTTRVLPRSAQDQDGRNVLPLLLKEDDLTLDMPEPGQVTALIFDAPPQTPGTKRSVFAKTRGWYEVHLRAAERAEAQNLPRIATEPGYVVQRALAEFATFRKTGSIPWNRRQGPAQDQSRAP